MKPLTGYPSATMQDGTNSDTDEMQAGLNSRLTGGRGDPVALSLIGGPHLPLAMCGESAWASLLLGRGPWAGV